MEDCYCGWCNAHLNEQEGFDENNGVWVCMECGHVAYGELKHEGTRFPGVVWICDECGDLLNNQDDFNDEGDSWKCKKCGCVNPLSEEEIEESDDDGGVPRAVMNVDEAQNIRDELLRKNKLTEEENFLLTEALSFLINTYQNPKDMMMLGGIYYEQHDFDLALKYYEMAAGYDFVDALSGLGYIWYYGRTGEKDYEKAFHYFSRAAKAGDMQSEYKVADMYKNGYFVEKDYDKYVEIIEELAVRVQGATMLGDPLPEIYTRLAKIRTEQGEIEEAVELYFVAKDFLTQRIQYNAFFGNLNIMSWLIADLYQLIEFDEEDFDLFDLHYLLKKPAKVHFKYKKKTYTVESLMDEGECVIRFGDKWFRTTDDFIQKAEIGGVPLSVLNQDLYLFEVER